MENRMGKLQKNCKEKILDTLKAIVYDSKGDRDEQDFRAGIII